MPAGYGIARLKAEKSAVVIMIARMTPGLSFLIPLFLLFQWLNLLGTLVAADYHPSRRYRSDRRLDHDRLFRNHHRWNWKRPQASTAATPWQVFRLVALPIARPGIVVAFILSVIFSWNNFVFGIVLASRETRTLPVAVYNMLSFEQVSWGPLAAAALIVTLPVLILTVFAQRQIVAGLTAGAVK